MIDVIVATNKNSVVERKSVKDSQGNIYTVMKLHEWNNKERK